MKVAGVIVGLGLLLLTGSGPVPAGHAQEASPPNIDLTVTDVLNRLGTEAPKREDLREPPPPPRIDRLSDSVRMTVSTGDPRCFPGEDAAGPSPDRFRSRATRPGRSR